MAIVALESAYGDPKLRDKLLFADTSFIWAFATETHSYHPVVNNFISSNPSTTFGINITVRQELLHFLRTSLIRQQIKREGLPGWAMRLCDERRKDLPKRLMEDAAGGIVLKEALQGVLKAELARIETTFPYYSGIDAAKKLSPSWDTVYTLMENLFLDSSDAMILNFANSAGFDGLVACDVDFATARDLPGVDIYLPRKLIPPLL